MNAVVTLRYSWRTPVAGTPAEGAFNGNRTLSVLGVTLWETTYWVTIANVTLYALRPKVASMTTAIALPKSDVPDSVPEMMQVANFLQHSTMVPRHLQSEPASLFLVMLKARALNIPMATAFDNVIVQEGKTGLTATLMQALVLRAGFGLYLYNQSDDQATVRAARAGIGTTGADGQRAGFADVSFSLADAEKARLINIDADGKVTARSKAGNAKPWETYTRDMLLWRAISRACRYFFSDVLLGMVYTPDELGAEVDEEGATVRVHSVRVDVPEAVKAFILRVNRAETEDELRALYGEISDQKMLSDLGADGRTLSQVVGDRKAALKAADQKVKADRAAKRAETKARKEALQNPAQTPTTEDTPPWVAPTEDGPAEDAENPAPEPAALIAEPEQPVEDGFDALPTAPADPADTEMTPRRSGVMRLLTEQFGDIGESVAVANFGRPLDTIGTPELQTWLVDEMRKANH